MSGVGTDPGARLELARLEIDPHIVRLIPREMARRFHLVAVAQENDALLVAMEDPLDVIATDTVAANTGYEIRPAAADKDEIQTAIDKYYGETLDIEKSIQNIVDVEVEAGALADGETEQLSIEPNDAPVIRLVNLIMLRRSRKARATSTLSRARRTSP